MSNGAEATPHFIATGERTHDDSKDLSHGSRQHFRGHMFCVSVPLRCCHSLDVFLTFTLTHDSFHSQTDRNAGHRAVHTIVHLHTVFLPVGRTAWRAARAPACTGEPIAARWCARISSSHVNQAPLPLSDRPWDKTDLKRKRSLRPGTLGGHRDDKARAPTWCSYRFMALEVADPTEKSRSFSVRLERAM